MIGGLIRDKARYLLTGASVIAVLALSTPADAQDNKAIEAQIKALQAQINALQREVEQTKAAAASSKSSSSDLDLKVRWRGAPEFSSADGNFKMKLRGRIHADYNAIDQDERITGRPDVSAAELRRARLGIEGVVWHDVAYKLEVDFANDSVALKDAYIEYGGLVEDLGLRVGHFKTFNSLEHLTSSNYITFLERSAFVDAFGLDRAIGAGAIYAQKHFTISGGVFGPTAANDEVWEQDFVKAGAARITLAPINNDTAVVHLGASWRGRDGADELRAAPFNPLNDEFFRYRARGADLHLADRFIATPQIFDEDTFWGLEGAIIWKSFYVSGEYAKLKANSSILFGTNPNPSYDGWYIDAGWYLTGEMRRYSEGEFGRIKVKNPVWKGGWGAWQIAGKYDVIDLTDKAVNIAACSLCGEQQTWLIGLNWWLNDHSRIMFNYNHSDIEGGALIKANGNSANNNDGATIKGFGTRFQVDW